MNILFRMQESCDGFVPELLDMMHARGLFDKCVAMYTETGNNEPEQKDYCTRYDVSRCFRSIYDELCDWDEVPSVPKSIWEDLKQYKSTIMNLTRRPFYSHVMNYEEMERIYIRSVMFWNYVLDRHGIGMCFFCIIPHTPWEYTIYALAKVKNIPTLILNFNQIVGVSEIGTSVDSFGENIPEIYRNLTSVEMTQIEQEGYDALTKTKSILSSPEEKEKRQINKNNRIRSLEHISKKPIIKTWIKYRALIKKNPDYNSDRYEYDMRHCIERYTHFWKMKPTEYFDNTLANVSEPEGKYILYLMQYVPEANTLPQAGECANQLLTIRMLADGAKRAGAKLYVKEHWEQLKREKDYYDDLKRIPNTYFVKTSDDTLKYVDNAIAVVSQTGSFLLEGLLTGKYRMTTVKQGLAYAPGCYLVDSAEDVCNAIKDIENRGPLDMDDCKKYYIAMHRGCVHSYLDWVDKRLVSNEEIKKEFVETIEVFIERGMTGI